MSIIKIIFNEHVITRTEPCISGRKCPGQVSHFSPWVDGWQTCVCYYFEGAMASEYPRRQCNSFSNMVLDILGPIIHVKGAFTCITYFKIIENHLHSFIATVFYDGSDIFQQDHMLFPTVPQHELYGFKFCLNSWDELLSLFTLNLNSD